VLSLLQCIAAAVLAVRSCWILDDFDICWKPAAAGPTSSGYTVGGHTLDLPL
jgi:hypothetical protein